MPNVTIECDRCKRPIEGFESESATSGFYRLQGAWEAFAQHPAETVICDDCMQHDPRYQQVYGGG